MKTHRRALATVWVACLLAAAATGCGSVSVRKLRPGPARELAHVASPFVGSPADGWLARAEAAYDAGRAEEEAKETERAADLYLDAVGDAGRVLEDPTSEEGGIPTRTRAEAAQALSNAAMARFLRLTSGRTMRLDESWRADLAARGVRVTIRRDEAVWDPESFDVLKFSADFAVLGLENQHCVDGLGVPLIAIRRAHLSDLFRRKGPEKFLMPRQVYPVTAVLRVTHPGDASSGLGPEAILELHDPLRYRRVSLAAGRTAPLAADLSTPLAFHLARSPLPILEQVGLLQPQWLERLAGLYMLHPYQPGKIPVVLVHGVWSSPRAWLQAINDLRGDPAIRDRYQFWIFLYPTGNPVTASAATLREALAEVRADPGPARGRPGARSDGPGRPQHGRAPGQDDAPGQRRGPLGPGQHPAVLRPPGHPPATQPAQATLFLRAAAVRAAGRLHLDPAPGQRAGRPVPRPDGRPADPAPLLGAGDLQGTAQAELRPISSRHPCATGSPPASTT